VGLVVLTGWTFGIPALTGHVAGLIPTIPNTATLFLVGATALWLARDPSAPPSRRRASAVLAAIVFGAGAFFFVERMTGLRSPLDLLLFGDAVQRYPYRPPGVPAINSTVCQMLAGAALLLLYRGTGAAVRQSQLLAAAGLMVAGTALAGYLFDLRPLYAIDRLAGMALPTALGFASLHVGILFARPDRGVVRLLTGDDLGAVMVRRILPATLAIPVALGWLWIRAREHALITREGGVALFVALTVLLLIAVLLRAGIALRATDRDRQALLAAETMARAEAQQLAATLVVRTEEAESASRAKSDFLATMSHELRTPLNAVIGYTQLLADEVTGPLTVDQQVQLGRIRVSARHLLSLIEEILTLSRLEAGKETVIVERVRLAGVVTDAAAIVEPLAVAKGLGFQIACDEVALETDAGKLRQILVNLLSNAVKFTERGEVSLRAFIDRDAIACVVRDTGIGIEPAHLEHIFEPFWQVERAATRRAGGTGLGLGVSRRLARLLGGELRVVESVPGRGSTFRVELPLAARGVEVPGLPAAASQQVQRA
jgi:signal transduction histidine kinase